SFSGLGRFTVARTSVRVSGRSVASTVTSPARVRAFGPPRQRRVSLVAPADDAAPVAPFGGAKPKQRYAAEARRAAGRRRRAGPGPPRARAPRLPPPPRPPKTRARLRDAHRGDPWPPRRPRGRGAEPEQRRRDQQRGRSAGRAGAWDLAGEGGERQAGFRVGK